MYENDTEKPNTTRQGPDLPLQHYPLASMMWTEGAPAWRSGDCHTC